MSQIAARYDITLTMGYDYGAPADHLRALVRLLPGDRMDRQVVTSRLLSVDPMPQERFDSSDFFGNTMTALAFHRPVDRISVTLRARVERLPTSQGLDLSPSLSGLASDLAQSAHLGAEAPHHYLGPSPRVPPAPRIAEFAHRHETSGGTVLQSVLSIGTALNNVMRFDVEATDVDTPPADAFDARHGVCQDFSHIMITALRALGVPAGYVSGFLRTLPPPGQAPLEGVDAMHAWVRAWCGRDMGWVEYDPTNACLVRGDHVSVAYGRDYSDVAPIKGVLRSVGQQQSHHSVDVALLP